jgi:osmotically-inducible protein OsmY
MAYAEQKLKIDILDALYWDNRINASNINVEVRDAEAKLSGTVSSYAARRIAEMNALTTPGIHSVKNYLTVKHDISPVPSDFEIRSMIQKVYLWNTVIDQSKIQLEVDKGIVTLKGTVTTLWEKARAEDLVDDIIGVVGVINELAVVPSESYADELIAKQILNTLEKNVLIDVDSVNVKVEDGRVLLSGSVQSNFARERAGEIALVTGGVIFVENLIKVGSTG